MHSYTHDKIRILVMSDLHLEFEQKSLSPGPDLSSIPDNIDLVLLAGDIDIGIKSVDYASRVKDKLGCEVALVSGNHEFYNKERKRALNAIQHAANKSSIYYLENNVAKIRIRNRSIRILGCTLWTDYCLNGNGSKAKTAMAEIDASLNDHNVIYEGSKFNFSTEDALRLHVESREWIADTLAQNFDGDTVIVTHHAPSKRSIHKRFDDDMLSPAFASNLDDLVKQSNAVLWAHGHMHDSFDYKIGNTRVICNPRGYSGRELNTRFTAKNIFEF